jgi:hypothetical protein
MKMIHRLTVSGLLAAVVVTVTVTEIIAWQVCRALALRFDHVAIGAAAAGLVLAFVAWRYDGDGRE